MLTSETKRRLDAGRDLLAGKGRRENVVGEHRVTKKVFAPKVDCGADFEHAPQSFVDDALLNTDRDGEPSG